jgi:hypothetical protein
MNQDINNLQENKNIRTIYEKLQENKRIVEECNKKIAELNEAVASLDDAIRINEEKNVTKEQIEKLETEIEAQEKASQLFENGNEQIKNDIAEKRKLLATLQASSMVNDTALKAYYSKKTDLLNEASAYIEKKQDALEMIENIAEIYDEKSERLSQRIEGIKADKDAKEADSETLVPLVSRYAELNKRYKLLCSFGNMISDKKAAEKKAIAEEMEDIKETFSSKMPDFNKKLLESAGVKLESKFELDTRRKEMAIQRQESRLKTLEKLAKQANDILEENDYVFDNQIHFYNRDNNAQPEETKKDEAQVEYTGFKPATPNNYGYNVKDATYGLVEPLKEHKLPEEKPAEEKKDFEQEFENEYAFLFGDNIMNNKNEKQEVIPPFPKVEPPKPADEETTKDDEVEANSQETIIEPPLDVFEMAIAGKPRYIAQPVEENNEEKKDKKTENKQSYKNNPKYSRFNQAILENAKEEKIKSKVKKKVEKEKKDKFFKRMFKG